jgi:hypothetical protein
MDWNVSITGGTCQVLVLVKETPNVPGHVLQTAVAQHVSTREDPRAVPIISVLAWLGEHKLCAEAAFQCIRSNVCLIVFDRFSKAGPKSVSDGTKSSFTSICSHGDERGVVGGSHFGDYSLRRTYCR